LIRITKLFQTLSSRHRLLILLALRHGPLLYSRLQASAGYRTRFDSGKFAFHLRKLKNSELVYRDGENKYRLSPLGYFMVFVVDTMFKGSYSDIAEFIQAKSKLIEFLKTLEERWDHIASKLELPPPPPARKKELSTVDECILENLSRTKHGLSFKNLLEKIRVELPYLEPIDVFYSLDELEKSGLIKKDKGVYVTTEWAKG